jgi:tRNA (cmo5U34)-methyltransferase
LSKDNNQEAIMDRKMDLDDVLSVSVKLRGLGYLIAQDRANWLPEDMDVIRDGIGLLVLVLDLGRRLADIARYKSMSKAVPLFARIYGRDSCAIRSPMKAPSTVIDHFTDGAKVYDERNRPLASIADNMHFLIRLILKDVPVRARVLCVGVGTGAEILSLSKAYPEWTFVGVDPSTGMLDVCRGRLKEASVLDRCDLIHGYVGDAPAGENFDVALSILVAHFIKREERLHFYRAMNSRLRKNGILINTEISFDLDSPEFPSMLKNWEAIQALMGATPESLANLSVQLREMLTVVSPQETEALLKNSGIPVPVQFFQAFMISGWYGTKSILA